MSFQKHLLAGASMLALLAAVPAASAAARLHAQATTGTGSELDLGCMRNAANERESAIRADQSAYADRWTAALEKRGTDIDSAFAIEDRQERRDALRQAWNAYRDEMRSARREFRDATRDRWRSFREAAAVCRGGIEESSGSAIDAMF